ncbi:MAG TPA: toxin-antitoxin system YwqK family antitoxin [Verrucomicrobiota bacterium]|nr:toxin-antitoxin system YwqK family antitoxin [Verrucomicrobiota bacterium]
MIPPSNGPKLEPGNRSAVAIHWLAVAVVAGTLLAGAVFLAVRSASKKASPEVDRTELTLIDGRLHRKGEPKAFTGLMIERYPGGALQSRSSVSNGLLHGVSEGWYTNGQKQVVEHFEAGVSHGLRIKWYPTGAKLSEANIVHGKIEGIFRKWHENGVLAEEIPMLDGQPDGRSRAYYPDGRLKAEAVLRAGRVLEQKFWTENEATVPDPDKNKDNHLSQSGP